MPHRAQLGLVCAGDLLLPHRGDHESKPLVAFHLWRFALLGGCSCAVLLAHQHWGGRSHEEGGLAFCLKKVNIFVDVRYAGCDQWHPMSMGRQLSTLHCCSAAPTYQGWHKHWDLGLAEPSTVFWIK